MYVYDFEDMKIQILIILQRQETQYNYCLPVRGQKLVILKSNIAPCCRTTQQKKTPIIISDVLKAKFDRGAFRAIRKKSYRNGRDVRHLFSTKAVVSLQRLPGLRSAIDHGHKLNLKWSA